MSLSDSSNAVVYPAAEQISYFMDEALSEAIKGREQNEVPVGAVVVHGNSIIARAHNLTESRKDPTAHAEILAIREASRVLDNWRLTQCALYVTLEPCTMCTGALREARIPLLVFGTPDERLGACGSIYDLSQQKLLESCRGSCKV